MKRSKSGIVAIPASAFEPSSTTAVSPLMDDLSPRGVGGGGGEDGRGVEAWMRKAAAGTDPRILKMEGMVSMHLELEKERMKSIAGGGGVGGEKGRKRGGEERETR